MGTRHPLTSRADCSGAAAREDLADLLAEAARGDVRSFMAFYDLTCATVHRVALATAVDPGQAEDLTCSTYACAWTRVTEYAGSDFSPLAWLLSSLVRPEIAREAPGLPGIEEACA